MTGHNTIHVDASSLRNVAGTLEAVVERIERVSTDHQDDQEATAQRRVELGWQIERQRLRQVELERQVQLLRRAVYITIGAVAVLSAAVAALAIGGEV